MTCCYEQQHVPCDGKHECETSLYVCIHICIYTHVHIICMWSCVAMMCGMAQKAHTSARRLSVCIHICIYTHVHIHMCIYTHVHIIYVLSCVVMMWCLVVVCVCARDSYKRRLALVCDTRESLVCVCERHTECARDVRETHIRDLFIWATHTTTRHHIITTHVRETHIRDLFIWALSQRITPYTHRETCDTSLTHTQTTTRHQTPHHNNTR